LPSDTTVSILLKAYEGKPLAVLDFGANWAAVSAVWPMGQGIAAGRSGFGACSFAGVDVYSNDAEGARLARPVGRAAEPL
jgi:hypothetical protein